MHVVFIFLPGQEFRGNKMTPKHLRKVFQSIILSSVDLNYSSFLSFTLIFVFFKVYHVSKCLNEGIQDAKMTTKDNCKEGHPP